jgi:hypothetical protein
MQPIPAHSRTISFLLLNIQLHIYVVDLYMYYNKTIL